MKFLVKLYILVMFIWGINIPSTLAANEIYLISANPVMNSRDAYPSILYHLDADKAELNRVRPITTLKQGALFVRPYHWENIVLIGSEVQPGYLQIDIIDMSDVRMERTVEIAYCSECALLQSYLFRDDRGRIGQLVISGVMKDDVLYEYLSGGDISSDSGKLHFGWSDFQYIQSYGSSGGNVAGGDELVGVFVENKIPVYGARKKIPLGWQLPNDLTAHRGERMVQMLNTDSVRVITSNKMVITSADDKVQTLYYIYDKKGKSWSTKLIDGDAHRMRGFGEWVVAEESYVGFDQQKKLNKEQSDRLAIVASGIVNTKLYASALARFKKFNIRQTGKIFLINIIENIQIELATGKSDSEVLLVVDNKIIYRVENELRTATREGGRVIKDEVLYKGDIVPSLHWAFLSK